MEMSMIRFVYGTLLAVLVTALSGCVGTPQWSEPVYKGETVTPVWLAGLWAEREGDGLMRLTPREHDFEVLYAYEKGVCLGSAFITTQNGDLFISRRPRDMKCLESGPPVRSFGPIRRVGKVPLAGYMVSYLDRISDDDVRITEIDYNSLFAQLETRRNRVGTDLCRHVPLSAEALERQRNACHEERAAPAPGSPESQPLEQDTQPPCQAVSDEAYCNLLDTRAVMQNGGGSILHRASSHVEYHRVKTDSSSGGSVAPTAP
jgi:hypothetical protein